MWNVYMLYPEMNTSGRGGTLLAQGVVRVSEMQVGRASTQEEARRLCLRLSVRTLKDHGRDTTVIGYGIRNSYDKSKKLPWTMTIEQLLIVLRNRAAKKLKKAA